MENISSTVNKSIDILQVFLDKGGELSLTEVAKLTGFDRATAYRILATLVKRGYISQPQKRKKYHLGLRMINFAYSIRKNLSYLDLIYPFLVKLSKDQDAAINLTVFDGDQEVVIDEIGISHNFRITGMIGQKLPLYSTACGKLTLASMTAEKRVEYYKTNELVSFTKNTKTNISLLEKELEVVKRDGIAFDVEENMMGVAAIAAPIFHGKETLFANVSIVFPLSHVDVYSYQRLAQALKNCTAELSNIISRNS